MSYDNYEAERVAERAEREMDRMEQRHEEQLAAKNAEISMLRSQLVAADHRADMRTQEREDALALAEIRAIEKAAMRDKISELEAIAAKSIPADREKGIKAYLETYYRDYIRELQAKIAELEGRIANALA